VALPVPVDGEWNADDPVVPLYDPLLPVPALGLAAPTPYGGTFPVPDDGDGNEDPGVVDFEEFLPPGRPVSSAAEGKTTLE
jgi:hypothetical protein